MPHRNAAEGHRVLVAAPFGSDADSLRRVLHSDGYHVSVCDGLAEVARLLDGHAGAILLSEEALRDDLAALSHALEAQESWSDIPFIVLIGKQMGANIVRRRLPEAATNVIILERPMGSETLLSAVGSALRARQRQFDVRDSQEALRASERELRLVADALPVLIAFVSTDRCYRFVNQAYFEWFGRPPAELIGRHIAEIAGEQGYEARRPFIERALAGETVRFELAWPRSDGERRETEIRYIPRRDRAGDIDGFHVFVADITERKIAAEVLEARVAERTQALHIEMANRARVEAELRQSQKMEAVGQLTGGIAHDFNNMLTGVIGGLDILRRRIATGRFDDLDRFMDAATTSAQRAAALTARLLAFSRRQSLDAKPLDVVGLIASLDALLRGTIGEQVTMTVVHAENLPRAVADANQLENAILNLCINARDAMPGGGSLTIETSMVEINDAHAAAQPDIAAGRYVVIAISDTGVGMAREILDKVYEPFFTTKPIGQGTGLGLSMVYGFARQSGGQVRIHSREGEGTSVKILLPASDECAAQSANDPASFSDGEGQTVLLVEDDLSVRLLICEVLAELGYRFIETAEAGEAIQVLASGEQLDLMISDVGLPGMTGRQLADVAREHRPHLPILFVTGYAENAAIRADFLGTNMGMVTKPFALGTLAEKIGEMLKKPGGAQAAKSSSAGPKNS